MGANTFFCKAKGNTAREAFKNAVQEAQYEYGHGGYSGTIAEKSDFVVITVPKGKDAEDYAYELLDKEDHRVDDKWGPAGCVMLEKGVYLFFGWASS